MSESAEAAAFFSQCAWSARGESRSDIATSTHRASVLESSTQPSSGRFKRQSVALS
jgi:hypothetical protein